MLELLNLNTAGERSSKALARCAGKANSRLSVIARNISNAITASCNSMDTATRMTRSMARAQGDATREFCPASLCATWILPYLRPFWQVMSQSHFVVLQRASLHQQSQRPRRPRAAPTRKLRSRKPIFPWPSSSSRTSCRRMTRYLKGRRVPVRVS